MFAFGCREAIRYAVEEVRQLRWRNPRVQLRAPTAMLHRALIRRGLVECYLQERQRGASSTMSCSDGTGLSSLLSVGPLGARGTAD